MILNATTILLPQDLGIGDSPTFDGLTLTGLTEGGVLFAGSDGLLSVDKPNLSWKDDTNQLGIGTDSPIADTDLDIRRQYAKVAIGSSATMSLAGVQAGVQISESTAKMLFGVSSTVGFFQMSTAHPLLIGAGGSSSIYVGTNGQIGMYTTTPTVGSLLDVRGGIDIGLDGTKLRFGAAQDVSIEYDNALATDGGLLIDLTSGGITNQNLSIVSTGDSDVSSPVFFVDGENARISLGKITPTAKLDILVVDLKALNTIATITDANSSYTALANTISNSHIAATTGATTISMQNIANIINTQDFNADSSVYAARNRIQYKWNNIDTDPDDAVILQGDRICSIAEHVISLVLGLGAGVQTLDISNMVCYQSNGLINTSSIGGVNLTTTITDIIHFEANNTSSTPGNGTLNITNQYGLKIAALSGATNNRAIWLAGDDDGSGGADIVFGLGADVRIYYDSNNDSGVFADGNWLMDSTNQLQFGDSGTYIYQGADGFLDLVADGAIRLNGDTSFVGAGAGLPYGSLYLHEGAVNVDISAVGQGVYVKITGLTTGLTNNVTINSDAFNVDVVGVYKVDWQISGDSQGNNKDYEVDIFVNGVEQADGSARREFGALGSLGSISGTAILDITNTGHDIDLRMKEIGAGAGTDFDIFNMNFNITQKGGT